MITYPKAVSRRLSVCGDSYVHHRLVRSHWHGFVATAGVDLADMFDHTDLHRHDFKLLADFFADGMLAAATGESQFVLGEFVVCG